MVFYIHKNKSKTYNNKKHQKNTKLNFFYRHFYIFKCQFHSIPEFMAIITD